ncbi:MAG TPA: copper homeostasis protein CutC [Acidobacteriaceae bacterium]|nr:copper homeostasis protein CutC [Acidobacteriaceae bacterium]
MTVLEICVDSLESAISAEAGGANRIELCNSLTEGGLTPSLGLIREVRSRLKIGIHVMIRPRAGDFLYSAEELAVMREDIAVAAQNGADGVALGLLTAEGDVDVERTRELIDLARPMEVTFHRAIDLARDINVAFQDVIRTGADRVLTSGAEPTAMQGRRRIGELVRAAKGRIEVMAGGGVRAENVQEIVRTTGVQELHAALRRQAPSQMKHQRRKVHLSAPGLDEHVRHVVRAADVQTLQQAIEGALSQPMQRA